MNFFAALVFSLVFFGIWSLKEAAGMPPPVSSQARTFALLIAIVFLVLGWALGRVL